MSTPSIHIDDLIDDNPISRLQWRVAAVCFVLAVVDGFDASSIGYVAPLLTDEFDLSAAMTGQILSSALIGLMIGALVGSPLADRIGRKPVILVSVAIMGIFSLLTATSDGSTDLFVFRFFTGLGLGGVMPNINTLTAEFAPQRRRALLMTVMFTGFPIGIIVGGLASAALISQFGWQSVFVLGGVLPLLMLPVAWLLLPESPRFLAVKGTGNAVLRRVALAIAPDTVLTASTAFVTHPVKGRGSIRALFSEGRTPVTLILWLTFFVNLLAMYALFGWLPTVLEAAGIPLDRAILVSVLTSVGGVVGGLVLAVVIDRGDAVRTMIATFVLAAIAIALVGQVTGSIPLLMLTLFFAGMTSQGSQFGLNALVSSCYDTAARATGLGWALAVGRLGAIIGPMMVGAAVGAQLSLPMLFAIGAIPMLIAAAALTVLTRIAPN